MSRDPIASSGKKSIGTKGETDIKDKPNKWVKESASFKKGVCPRSICTTAHGRCIRCIGCQNPVGLPFDSVRLGSTLGVSFLRSRQEPTVGTKMLVPAARCHQCLVPRVKKTSCWESFLAGTPVWSHHRFLGPPKDGHTHMLSAQGSCDRRFRLSNSKTRRSLQEIQEVEQNAGSPFAEIRKPFFPYYVKGESIMGLSKWRYVIDVWLTSCGDSWR